MFSCKVPKQVPKQGSLLLNPVAENGQIQLPARCSQVEVRQQDTSRSVKAGSCSRQGSGLCRSLCESQLQPVKGLLELCRVWWLNICFDRILWLPVCCGCRLCRHGSVGCQAVRSSSSSWCSCLTWNRQSRNDWRSRRGAAVSRAFVILQAVCGIARGICLNGPCTLLHMKGFCSLRCL